MDTLTGASKRERRKSNDGTVTTAERPSPLLVRRSSRDNLPTPTTTAKDDACCSCWDLHEAAATHGGSEAVRRYLVGGGDPKSDQWGNSALHVAAHAGREDIARVLLGYNAHVDQRNRSNETPLHVACRQGHTKVVRFLLENGSDPRSKDICGRLPSDLCSDQETGCRIAALLGRSEELKDLGSLKRRVHTQISHSNMQGVEKLLELGGSIDFRDAAERTILHRACEDASVDVVAKLLALGATVNATEKRRQTPLHRACEKGRLDVVRLLVGVGEADTRAKAKLQHEPLHVACLGNWGEVVKFLLTEGHADAEARDKNGMSSLHLAIERNKLESILELTKHGCDVEGPLSDGLTRPLHVACRRGLEKAATILLDKNADHTARGPGGQTSLHMAAKEGKLLVVELLLSRKVDLHAKDTRGLTPMNLTNNRRCKERLREAERREEKALAERSRTQAEIHKRQKALKRKEKELLERVGYRSRGRMGGGIL